MLDDRRKNDLNYYSVKLRVTHNRVQKYYSTGFRMNTLEFAKTMQNVPLKKYENNRIELDEMLLKARNACKELHIFSFIGFEKIFLNDKKPDKTLFQLYEKVISEKMLNGSVSTATNYRCSMKSLLNVNKNLTYADITPDFLYEYETALLKDGKKTTTVGIYLRPLRAIINEAISLGYLPQDLYPFGRRKYIIPEGKNPKKALENEEFQKIWNYKCREFTSFEGRSKDFFILSYLCQGINFKDLLLMKKDQLSETEIQFFRQKTKDTVRSNPILITVPLLDETKVILNQWKDLDETNPFLFNFITEEMTPVMVYKNVMQFVKVTNKHMNQIAKSLGIKKNITTYVARHQFSKAIIEGGESVELLSECLGHKNIRTTQNYVQRFSIVKRLETARKNLIPNTSENYVSL